MADIFISFKTADTSRVAPIRQHFIDAGWSVFWSNEVPLMSPNYQRVIVDAYDRAKIVVGVLTNASRQSDPVIQECKQAGLDA
jgi:TIR domain